jgi:hypothetical protein
MIKTLLMRVLAAIVILWPTSNAIFANPANNPGSQKSVVDNLVGVYEYIYEYNTKNLTENHYIVLESEHDFVVGRYYGTSDDFDDAREGYLPGFFVAPLRQLSIQGQKISFQIELHADDLFLNPIELSIRSSQEVDLKKNKRWIADYQPGIRLTRSFVTYTGEITNGEFHITTQYGVRVFKKIK